MDYVTWVGHACALAVAAALPVLLCGSAPWSCRESSSICPYEGVLVLNGVWARGVSWGVS